MAQYACDYLETWHVLLSFVINHDTVAGAVLAEYLISISDYEHATFVVTDKVYREELDSFRILPSSKRLDETASFAKKIAEVVKAKELGTEHLFMAMLLDKRSTSQIFGQGRFCFEDSDDKFRFLDLRKTWRHVRDLPKRTLKLSAV